MCPPCKWTTTSSRLDHWPMAQLIRSWLIMSRQTVRDLFEMVNVFELLTIHQLLKSVPNWVIHRIQIRWVSRPVSWFNKIRNISLQDGRCVRSVRRRTVLMTCNYFRLYSKEYLIRLHKFCGSWLMVISAKHWRKIFLRFQMCRV